MPRATAFALALWLALASPALAEGVSRADVETWADDYAWWYETDAYPHDALVAHVLRVAKCETGGWDVRVINNQRLGRLGEVGVGQFHARGIWWSTPQAVAGYSRYDVEANVAGLTWAISRGLGARHWYFCWRNG